MKILRFIFCISLLHLCLAAQAQSDTLKSDIDYSTKPSCDCDSLWTKQDAKEFIQLLEKTTSYNKIVWPGYKLTDATIVVDAGKISTGEHCLGLWKTGKSLSFTKMNQTLQMLTPIYSYYLNYKGMDSAPDIEYFKTAQNATEFQKMDANNGCIISRIYTS